jgi:signal transduction histidine kinase/ActR/RegA family two-component response regulator
VIEAATGKEALELSRQQPTVIILDVKLPDIVGYEVCRRIKANSQTRHIPVLQLSAAFLSNESKLYALESGADAYLVQPVDPVVLVATVKSLVRVHQAESAAQLAARQWQITFDALSEGVATIDASCMIRRCNRAMTTLLNKPYSEIENCPFHEVVKNSFGLALSLPPDNSPIEVKFDSRFFRLSLDPIASHEEGTSYVFIVAETTKQKLAEEALLITERLAATGRMAHTIAHEINNPLESITNLLYLLQSSLDKPQIASQFLTTAASELARVSRISRQILSFNRESSLPIEISISEIIEDVLALNNRAVVDKELRIERDFDSPLVAYGFPAQLRQVFSNLVRNAVEASAPRGRIRIKISASKLWCSLGKEAVRITIADNGIGIPAENRKRIFDAFFTTKDLKGSGIGLWLSASIIHEHGGYIRLRSATQPACSGTCLSVIIPGGRKR